MVTWKEKKNGQHADNYRSENKEFDRRSIEDMIVLRVFINSVDALQFRIKKDGFVIERTGFISSFFFAELILNESGIHFRINH